MMKQPPKVLTGMMLIIVVVSALWVVVDSFAERKMETEHDNQAQNEETVMLIDDSNDVTTMDGERDDADNTDYSSQILLSVKEDSELGKQIEGETNLFSSYQKTDHDNNNVLLMTESNSVLNFSDRTKEAKSKDDVETNDLDSNNNSNNNSNDSHYINSINIHHNDDNNGTSNNGNNFNNGEDDPFAFAENPYQFLPSDSAIVTVATIPDFLLSACVLGLSLRNRTNLKHRIVLTHDTIAPKHSFWYDHLLQSGWSEIRFVSPIANPAEEEDKELHDEWRRREIFTKMRALSLTEFHRILYLDSDIVVAHHIDHIFEKYAHLEFAARPQAVKERPFKDAEKQFIEGDSPKGWWLLYRDYHGKRTLTFNAGVLLYRPYKHLFSDIWNLPRAKTCISFFLLTKALIQMLEEEQYNDTCLGTIGGCGDQMLLCMYYRDRKWTYLPTAYNCPTRPEDEVSLKKAHFMKQQLLETNETIVVDHYAGGHKPWSRDIDEWRQVEKKGAVKVWGSNSFTRHLDMWRLELHSLNQTVFDWAVVDMDNGYGDNGGDITRPSENKNNSIILTI